MVSAPDRHQEPDAGHHLGGGIDAGHGFPYGVPFEGSLNDGPGFVGTDAPTEADSVPLRALWAVPERLPNLRGDAAGNRIAARSHRADEGRSRGAGRHQRAAGVALGAVPAMPGLRGGVSVGSALRPADGAHAGAGAGQRTAKLGFEPSIPVVPAGGAAAQSSAARGGTPDAALPAVGAATAGAEVRVVARAARRAGRDGSADAGDGAAVFQGHDGGYIRL